MHYFSVTPYMSVISQLFIVCVSVWFSYTLCYGDKDGYIQNPCPFESVARFKEREEEVGVGVTEARLIYSMFYKITLMLEALQNKHKFTALWRFSGIEQQLLFPESSVCPSLPLSVTLWLLRSLHANHWNEKQVNVILHLTHLLTAHLQTLSPSADSANHAPPHHRKVFENLKMLKVLCVG